MPLTEQAAANLATGKNNIVARTINDIVSFVKNARSKKGGSERLYMGTIPDSAARLIRDQTGVEVSGYTAILPGSSVQHIFKNHGDTQKEATRGQRAVSAEDIAQIPKVLASPDAVTLSEDTDVFGRPVLLFSKQIGDTYITAQAVTDGRHMLATNTLWIQKKKNPLVTESNAAKRDPAHNAQSVPPSGSSFESTPSEMNADETAPVPTSKTPEPVLPTAPIIADSSAKGNTQSAQNSGGQTGDDGVGAANAGFAGDYNRLQNQSERFHPEGEKAARPVDVPVEDFQGRSIPKSTATVLESGATPDREFTQRIDSNRKGSQKEKSPEPDGSGDLCLMSCLLHSAGDLTRTEAAGADVHVLGRAVHDRLDALHIGLPGAVRAAVRVGHLNTERNALIAKLAFGHFLEPPRWSKYQLILDSNQSIE